MLNITGEINKLIKEINDKNSLNWAEARTYPSEIKVRLEKIVAECQKEIDKISQETEQTQKFRNELEQKNKSLQTEKEQLELLLQQFQDQAKASEKLQSELVKKQRAVSELQEKLTTAQNEAEKLRQEITALEKQIANDSEKEILKEQLAGKRNQLANAENNVKSLEEKRNSLDKEVSRLQTALIKKNKEENSKIAELQQQLVDLQSQLNAEQAELDQVRKEAQTAKEAKEKAEQERDDRPAIKKDDFVADYQKRPTKSELDQAVEAERKEKEKLREQLVAKDKDIAEKDATTSGLKNELELEKEKLRKAENDKIQLDNQKQELTKKTADLADEISRLKEQIVQQTEIVKQFPAKASDYERQIEQLKKENFGLKNSQNEELEKVQKQLTELLTENNPLRVVDMEEAKVIMTEHLEFARKEKENFEDLIKNTNRTKEKMGYEEKQKKWEARIEQVQQIIDKLKNSSNQQLMNQIEIKK